MYWNMLLSYQPILSMTLGGQGGSTGVIVGMVIPTYYGRLDLMSWWSTIGDMHPEDGSELWSQYIN